MRRAYWLVAALVVLLGCGDMAAPIAQSPSPEAPPPLTEKVPLPDVGRTPTQTSPAPATFPASSTGFRSKRSFDQHFAKHGAEFGHITQAEYLALAQRLRDRPAGGPILEIVRESDGVVTRYDRETGHFGAYNRDRTIRTFFIPNDGESYFHRQARRPH